MMLGIGLIGINEKEFVISVINYYLYVLYFVIFVCLNVIFNLIVGRVVWSWRNCCVLISGMNWVWKEK